MINLSPAAERTLERAIAGHLGTSFPALAITALWRGEVLLDRAWGTLDPETGSLPVQHDTLFDLASVSKPFTAAAFLSLVSGGSVMVDTPLVEVIPEFGASGPRPLDGGQDPHSKASLPTPESVRGQTADPARVTFRLLLTHTAGLAPWRDVFNAAGPAPVRPDQPDPLPRQIRWNNALQALCRYPFVGQPGDGEVRYSDLGLMLLGEAVSRLHGTPGDLEAAISARVCAPLALAQTGYTPLEHGYTRQQIAPTEDDPGWRGRRCWGEVHDENACGVGGIAGHAGLFGTAQDVAAFGQAWLERDERLGIDPDLMALAIQQHAQTGGMRRGLGWMLKALEDSSAGDRFSTNAYGHLGFTGTSLWIDPQRALVAVVLTNRVYEGREPRAIHAFRRAAHDALAQAVDDL